jgi:hypothetical protein
MDESGERKLESPDIMKDRFEHGQKSISWHTKAVKLLTKLAQLVYVHLETYGMNPISRETLNLCTDLENLHDYYLYEVLDATKETAPSLFILLLRLGQQAYQQEDPCHSAFFLALAEMLKVKCELGTRGEKIKRNDFERSFNETAKKYGLGLVRKSENA